MAFPDRAVSGLHVRSDAANHRDANSVGHLLLSPSLLRDKHGDVRHDRWISLRVFSAIVVSKRTVARKPSLDLRGLWPCRGGHGAAPHFNRRDWQWKNNRIVP